MVASGIPRVGGGCILRRVPIAYGRRAQCLVTLAGWSALDRVKAWRQRRDLPLEGNHQDTASFWEPMVHGADATIECYKLMRCLTNLARGSQDFDQRSSGRTPELQLSTLTATRNVLLKLVESLLNDSDGAVAVPFDHPGGSDPNHPVHGGRVAGDCLTVHVSLSH